MKFKKVFVEISNQCNLSCSFCPQKDISRTPAFMDLGLFEKIIQEVVPLTEEVCLHLMGEPLLHPEFARLMNICDQYHARVYLVTNGIFFEKHCSILSTANSLKQLNVSVHSLLNQLGEEATLKILEPLFSFSRPDIFVNYRFWNGGNSSVVAEICRRFNVSSPDNFFKNHKLKDRTFLHFDEEFSWPSLEAPLRGEHGFCHALSAHFGILVDGSLVPCCLDSAGANNLGNCSNESIPEILNSKVAKEMLQGLREKKLIKPLCQHCCYIERFKIK